MHTQPPPKDPNSPEKMMYKTKLIQFFGRKTPIILQNDNGPCPLIAICNVLLLRNQLTLSSDLVEVSQEKLLSLVAERLIDANSNVNNFDAQVQQQKIGDAIDLLPRLTTGINVNLKFRRIDDFEFTEECAIFDLLDIPLCHGWIVDPKDSDTASAIGWKSYNTLMGELVALDTEIWESDLMNSDDDCVDFVAATTASLGTPSPSLTRHISFDDSPFHHSVSEDRKERRGDREEEEELLRALKQSEAEISAPQDDSYLKQQEPAIPMEVNTGAENEESCAQKSLIVDDNKTLDDDGNDLTTFETASRQDAGSSSQCENDERHEQMQAISEKHEGKDEIEKARIDALVKSETAMEDSDTSNAIPPVNTTVTNSGDEKIQDQPAQSNDLNIVRNVDALGEMSDISYPSASPIEESEYFKDLVQIFEDGTVMVSGGYDMSYMSYPSASPIEELESFKDLARHISESQCSRSSADGSEHVSGSNCFNLYQHSWPELVRSTCTEVHEVVSGGYDMSYISHPSASPIEELESFKDLVQHISESQCSTSSADGSEPIFEGGEYVQETSTTNYEDQEPMYESEVVLAEQADKVISHADQTKDKSGITRRQGDLIRKFLKNSANQLTIYGLFSLQECLKERELCVFFRNNHFNTMFKFEGELYLLATDQGYISQPDLVWEKLDEVNGNTVYMTGSFKEFNAENPDSPSWDEQNALDTTAEYIASIDEAAQEDASFNSDLQLAIALQQQDFEQQQQRQHPQRNVPHPNTSRESGLVIGPQSKIGSVRRAAAALFDASMERCDFGNIKRRSLIFSCTNEEYGDYTCDNVLRIWPKLREIGTKLQGPKDVGKEIKRNLQQSDMIEGTPSLHGAGFLSFKISGKWIAKRIHRMLIDGIETWAPEVLLERAIVTFPSLDITEEMNMDMLRCRYISRSLIRMFQYCQVEASHMDLARNIIKIEERGEVVIYSKAQGGQKSFVETESGQGLGNASKDLGALRYGVEKLNAQWLLYVTPVAKKEYIEMCFNAAKDAGWLSNAHLKPPYATYVGYRGCTTTLEKLVYMLNQSTALHKVASFVLQGDAANYSARDVLECSIQYTLLKTPRMADCTFNVDVILDEHGDTFLYLLNTQARIRSITSTSRKHVSELKNASELKLEKVDLLMKGEERELALHILDFAEVLQGSCFSVLPHILCKYLYNLSEIFNRYFVSTGARGWRSRFPLLLCEATRVVMDTCFHILEITPQSFKNELGVTRLLYGAQLSVEPPIDVGRNRPPRIPNTRFEPFSIHLRVNPDFEWDCELKVIKVFGFVDVEDWYGLGSEGWTVTYRPDVCYVGLFRRPWTDPVDMINGGCLSFGNPTCCRSVSFSSSIGISIDLTALNEKEDDLAPICKYWDNLDLSRFRDSNLDGSCGHVDVEGEGGQARIHYILLKDAVDATIEITFRTALENLEVNGEIVAYYDEGFPSDCDVLEKTFYMASLFEVKSGILKSGPIRLQKSQMAVPRKGSLKVQAYLIEVKPWRQILSTCCVFPSQTEGSNQNCLEGTDCSFQVKVNWSYVVDDVF